MRLDLFSLRIFLTAVEEGNLTRAAEREHIAGQAGGQPTTIGRPWGPMSGLTGMPNRPPRENRQARSTDARQHWRAAFAGARGAAAQDRASEFG